MASDSLRYHTKLHLSTNSTKKLKLIGECGLLLILYYNIASQVESLLGLRHGMRAGTKLFYLIALDMIQTRDL
jgi:hypothetical protein